MIDYPNTNPYFYYVDEEYINMKQIKGTSLAFLMFIIGILTNSSLVQF